ncbi:protease inhibitor I42 family protein [Chitinibacter sp. S2-10]|uniref:protease inhibitor I42 family protein n=1 Tax=Chitinibacter sp. S2-10 TaxID=3373597 RepID=UPI003977BE0F
MKRIMKLLIPTLALMLAFFSPSVWAERTVTQREHRQTIVLKPKETLLVKLPADPSTGYLWFFEALENQALNLLQDRKFTPRKKGEINRQGDASWRFSAQSKGEVKLRFEYRKPWQGSEVEPLDVREFNIIVDDTKGSA